MDNTFGQLLKTLRKEKRFSQKELGDQALIPQTTISDWENGKRLPDISEAQRLANVLGCDIIDFTTAI